MPVIEATIASATAVTHAVITGASTGGLSYYLNAIGMSFFTYCAISICTF